MRSYNHRLNFIILTQQLGNLLSGYRNNLGVVSFARKVSPQDGGLFNNPTTECVTV